MGSLILTRKVSEKLLVILESGETLEIEPIHVRGQQVRLRLEGCPKTFTIKRQELLQGIPDEIAHRQASRAAGEDRRGHGEDEAPPEALLQDS